MKIYTIPDFGITVKVSSEGIATIESGLREVMVGNEPPDDIMTGSIDALESLILGHASAGLDIGSPEYVTGLRTCLEAIANNS